MSDTFKETKKVEKNKVAPHPEKMAGGARRLMNCFMIALLLMVAGGLYLYNKGYLDHYTPTLKSMPLSHVASVPTPLPTTSPPEPVTTVSSPEVTAMANQLEHRLDSLEANLKDLTQQIEHLKHASIPPALSQGPLITLLAFQELRDQINQGLPFVAELNAFKGVLTPQDFEAFQAYATLGVPSLSTLTLALKDVLRDHQQAERMKLASTWIERAQATLEQLIHIEKVGEKATPAPATNPLPQNAHSYDTLRDLLRHGDIKGVYIALESFPHPTTALEQWVIHAKALAQVTDLLHTLKDRLLKPLLPQP